MQVGISSTRATHISLGGGGDRGSLTAIGLVQKSNPSQEWILEANLGMGRLEKVYRIIWQKSD